MIKPTKIKEKVKVSKSDKENASLGFNCKWDSVKNVGNGRWKDEKNGVTYKEVNIDTSRLLGDDGKRY